MQIKPLEWTYIGSIHCLWTGKTDFLLGELYFFIDPIPDEPDKVFLRTEINGIPNVTCTNIAAAKIKAQQILDNYSISLVLP